MAGLLSENYQISQMEMVISTLHKTRLQYVDLTWSQILTGMDMILDICLNVWSFDPASPPSYSSPPSPKVSLSAVALT